VVTREDYLRSAIALVREGLRLDTRRRQALEKLAGAYLSRAVAG
jgi:hypothetical protein